MQYIRSMRVFRAEQHLSPIPFLLHSKLQYRIYRNFLSYDKSSGSSEWKENTRKNVYISTFFLFKLIKRYHYIKHNNIKYNALYDKNDVTENLTNNLDLLFYTTSWKWDNWLMLIQWSLYLLCSFTLTSTFPDINI